MSFKAILFDLDGTLIDSALHWEGAYKKFIEKFNVPFFQEHINMVNGKSLAEASQIFKDINNLSNPVEEILAHKISTSAAIYGEHSLPLIGAEDLLKRIKNQNNKKTAIASGSSLDRIKIIMERFGWHNYFHALVSADHVDNAGKPDPAIFLYAAKELGVLPNECVVIEDAENGLNAAKSAGMQCVINFDERWCHGDYSGADLIVNSLADKQLYDFLGINYV